jgi:hypothetical protein
MLIAEKRPEKKVPHPMNSSFCRWIRARKSRQINLFCRFITAALLQLVLVGCQTRHQAKVVRLIVEPSNDHWKLTVNGKDNRYNPTTNWMTNSLAALELRHGDLILFGSLPDRKNNRLAEDWHWLSRFCEANRIATYFYGVYSFDAASELFSIPVYHWVAPFDSPMDLQDALFFREGKLLGTGKFGFEKMLSSVKEEGPKKVFVLGSLYDLNRSWPPDARPYEMYQDRFEEAFNAVGAKAIVLSPEPGF